MSERVDLMVIGAGPAGSTLATLAARAGLRVRLVERAVFPRDKVCGEFLSAEGAAVLRRLGVLDALLEAGARWMRRVRIGDLAGRHVDAPLPALTDGGRDGLGVSRARLDRSLRDAAVADGAELLQPWEATEPWLEDGRVVGMRLRAVGTRRSIRCRATLVAAADGRRSRLGRSLLPDLGDPRRSGPRSWFGLQTHLDAAGSGIEDRIELHLFPGGYAGLGRVEDGRLNLACLVTVRTLRSCGGSPERLFLERMRTHPGLRTSLGRDVTPRDWRSVGPLRWGVRRAASHGALFLGDAAGTVDPFSGEGMSHAMVAAELALPVVLQAVRRGGLDPALADGYERAWRKRFSAATRRIRILGRVLERPALATPLLGLLRGAGGRWLPDLIAASRTGGRGG